MSLKKEPSPGVHEIIRHNLKWLRKKKLKLTQEAFGELFGISRSSVGAYEEGRAHPRIELLIGLSDYLGLSMDLIVREQLTFQQFAAKVNGHPANVMKQCFLTREIEARIEKNYNDLQKLKANRNVEPNNRRTHSYP